MFNPLPVSVSKQAAHEDREIEEFNLEKVEIPKFSDVAEDWLLFKSMFKSLIIDKKRMLDKKKCQILKFKVQGKALDLIKDTQLIPEIFQDAWDILENYYENKRRLINNYLKNLLSFYSITKETSSEVARLLQGALCI